MRSSGEHRGKSSAVTKPAVGSSIAGIFALFGLAAVAGAIVLRTAPLGPWPTAGLSFAAVVAGALLISWGAEAAQFYVSQGLAVAFIALLQVMPEFMVEANIAWRREVDLMFANATGSNRILIGVGWPLIFFTADIASRLKGKGGIGSIRISREHIIEVFALLVSSAYYLVLLAKGTLSPVDSIVLGGFFVIYLWLLARLPPETENGDDMLAPARFLIERPVRFRREWILAVFVVGAIPLLFVADPFVTSMKTIAVQLSGARTHEAVMHAQFVFVQWVAPFLSEFPEKLTAFYWSRTVRLAPMALLNMISSTVSQYTALVAMIPLVYSASVGHFAAVPMSPLHRDEVFLSFAMTLYGCAALMKLRFTLGNALVVLGGWLLQFRYPGVLPYAPIDSHVAVAWAFVALAALEVVLRFGEIHRALPAALSHARSLLAIKPRP